MLVNLNITADGAIVTCLRSKATDGGILWQIFEYYQNLWLYEGGELSLQTF